MPENPRKKTRELEKELEFYRRFVEDSKDIFTLFDKNMNIVYANWAFLDLAKAETLDEIKGINVNKIVHRDDLVKLMEQINSGRDEFIELRALTAKKGTIYVSHRFKSEYGPNNEFIGVWGISRDITEQKKAEQALIESEQRLKNFFENLAIPAAIINLDGTIVNANPAVEAYYGLSRKELIGGKNIYDFIVKEEQEKVEHFLKRRKVGNGEGFNIAESRGIFHDEERNLIITSNSLPGNENLVITLQDITEEKKLGRELKYSEERYRSIVEQALVGVFTIQEGVVQFANDSVSQITGWSFDELKKLGPMEFLAGVHPNDQELVRNRYWASEKNGKQDELYEYRLVRKDGEVRWVLANNKQITLGGRSAVLGILIDITEQKRLEEELLRHKYLIENSTDAIVQSNHRLKVIYANKTFTDIFGPIEKINKGSLLDLVHPYDLVKAAEKVKLLSKEPITYRAITKDGKIAWISNTITPYFDERGKFAGIHSIGRDITKQKKLEQEIKKYSEMMAKMGVGITHDFRTFAQIVQGIKEIIETFDSPETEAVVDIIKEIIPRIVKRTTIYEQFINSRDSCKYRFKPHNIKDMVAEILEDYKLMTLNIDILDKIPELGLIECDKSIRFVFNDYIHNAIKALERPGSKKIEIGYSSGGREHTFYVRDNGIGLGENELKNLFSVLSEDELKKIFSVHRDSQGAGVALGLYTCKQIVSNHGGRAWAESDGPSKGSTFYFTIPKKLTGRVGYNE